jgi:hypothetical protein
VTHVRELNSLAVNHTPGWEGQARKELTMRATQDHLEYLDTLRESGVTNMFGAAPYLVEKFGLTKQWAREVLSEWMKTFSERHK